MSTIDRIRLDSPVHPRLAVREAASATMPAPTTLPPQGAEADPFEPLRVHLLGQIRIAIGDRVIPDAAWPPRGARTLLLLLLISPRHTLPRERVLDLLWPE